MWGGVLSQMHFYALDQKVHLFHSFDPPIKIDLLRHPHLWVGEWVGSGQMTNLIKLELIDIIQFCLKIYDLPPQPLMGLFLIKNVTNN